MKRSAFISIFLLTASSITSAAVVNSGDSSLYIADGVSIYWQGANMQTDLKNSTRFYDSTKGAEWTSTDQYGNTSDYLMCWTHASSNVIQYWQSYYGVFAKPQQGVYYNANGTMQGIPGGYPSPTLVEMPLPYGKIGTEPASYGSAETVSDGKQLAVARDMYYNMNKELAGTFKAAAEWFFRGQTDLQNSGGTYYVNNQYTGGYYKNYYSAPPAADAYEDPTSLTGLSYTTVYSEYIEGLGEINNSTTGTFFENTDLSQVKSILLQALGFDENGEQTEQGKLAYLGVWHKVGDNEKPTGHMVTCYGFTTKENGTIKSLIISDSDDGSFYDAQGIEQTSLAKEVFVNIEDDRIKLYDDEACSNYWQATTTGYYLGEISYLNTPEVLKNMLSEYSDTANEAQVWNGMSSEWRAQTVTTEALPTAATGWDINVNGDNIAGEHQGYYHTYALEGRNVEFGEHADANNRTVTVTGTVHARNITVSAAGYEFKAGEDAAIAGAGEGEKANLTITSGASLSSEVQLNLGDLTLENGAELSSDKVIEVHGAFLVKLQEAATFGLARAAVTPEASVNADLDLRDATSITLNAVVNMNNHNLILSADTPITLSLNEVDGSIIFFTNIAELSIADGEVTTVVAEGANLTQYFSNITTADGRDLSGYQVIYSSGTLSMTLVPEPTTATLSLLALAALATRRRRK